MAESPPNRQTPNPTVHRTNTKIAIRKVRMIKTATRVSTSNIKTAMRRTNIEAATGTTAMKTPIAPVIAPATRPPAIDGVTTIGQSLVTIWTSVGVHATRRLTPITTTSIIGIAAPRPIPEA